MPLGAVVCERREPDFPCLPAVLLPSFQDYEDNVTVAMGYC